MASAPEEIRVTRDRRTLVVGWADHRSESYPAEMLRVLSPSAEVQGHSPDQRVTVAGKKDVAIVDVVPVGNYAVRIVFDDGHSTGLYTWRYLVELADEGEERWQAYLDELAQKRLRREP
ncbi:gamma-butyrobetaine hydroxylase-like domain-containing protein [Consotaella aegiceratis]|uniref:gamma-butyrobetaine hydroxylase-like domain-containing protein n=1 Tax=Consotaella aegiceratis TaxID=3097961 RepID=UPI003D804CE1